MDITDWKEQWTLESIMNEEQLDVHHSGFKSNALSN